MDQGGWLAERFEANRSHLRAVAYRMLGSLSEADDAVHESRTPHPSASFWGVTSMTERGERM